MKVTQIVKQAIQTRVNEIAKPKLEPMQKQLKALIEENSLNLERIKDELKKELNVVVSDALTNMMKKHPEVTLERSIYSYRINRLLTKSDEVAEYMVENDMCFGCINYKKNERDALQKQINDFKEKIDKTINDIILELELGSSKKDLETLLAKVKF